MSTGAAAPRLLLSAPARAALAPRLAPWLDRGALRLVDDAPGVDCEFAFVSREVTGLSTKHALQPQTRRFYDLLLAAPGLRWVQAHSAGLDRPVFVELARRGVEVSAAAGANAAVVAHSALAGLLALARHLPLLMAQQRERRWSSLMATGLPRDLGGQTVALVGWGPVAQHLGAALRVLGLRLRVLRHSGVPVAPDVPTYPYEALAQVLPHADWLVLACPLGERTRGLVDAAMLARLPSHARLVNVARGEIVDEAALVDALAQGRLAGAFLDVFAHEPLPPQSTLWTLPNVIVSPHSAGFSDGNGARVEAIFLHNLAQRLQPGPSQASWGTRSWPS